MSLGSHLHPKATGGEQEALKNGRAGQSNTNRNKLWIRLQIFTNLSRSNVEIFFLASYCRFVTACNFARYISFISESDGELWIICGLSMMNRQVVLFQPLDQPTIQF
jgi:hypothetical protein